MTDDVLPTFPPPGVLTGPTIELVPFDDHHRGPLRSAAELDQSIWDYFPQTFNGAGEDFDSWFDYTLSKQDTGEHIPFAVVKSSNGRIIGTTRFYDLAAIHRRLAIGSTWLAPEARGTRINAEARWLLLHQAFSVWQVNRVELITDPRNLASRAAMKLLGAVQEGVIRRHLIYKDGRVRDSILFSIIREEWPAVSQRLITTVGEKLAVHADLMGHSSETTST